MCGICGELNMDGQPVDREEFGRRNDVLVHRGPNDAGVFVDKNIALGNRRLSIIDLETGTQPIPNEDRSIWVVCNGEIYNYRELTQLLKSQGHRFATKSDIEVIIHLYEQYGADCVKHLRGIFAFAVWDKRKQKLFLARDHLGVKPLFYYFDSNRIVFGSEIKAIIADETITREVNRTAQYHYFSLNYVPSPLTMFENIYSLPAGHYLECLGKNINLQQYWDLSLDKTDDQSEEEIKDRLKNFVNETVKLQLVSDVPVGSFLSGGLDSSILVSSMRTNLKGNFKTFNVKFKDSSYDESGYARLLAKHCGTEHHEILCEARDYLKCINDIIWHADNLTVDISMLPLFMVSKLASEHVKVVLSGDGADELFAGYPTYRADQYAAAYRKLPRFVQDKWIPHMVNQLPVSEKKMSFGFKARRFIYGARLNAEQAHYSWRLIFTEEEKEMLFAEKQFDKQIEDSFWAYERFYRSNTAMDGLSRHQYADIKVWMVDSILAKVDFMSMANSLEVRVPYLDPKFVEFVMSIPSHFKLKSFDEKYILKKALGDKIPQAILKREKAGFQLPIGKWLRGELKGLLTDVVCEQNVKREGYLNWRTISNMLEDHFNLKRDYGYQLLSLLHYFLWYDKFIVGQEQAFKKEHFWSAK